MADIFLTLHEGAFVLPSGKPLFAHLNGQFGRQPTGLVGSNGIGKTTLARVLAGQLPLSDGYYRCSGPITYLAQQVGDVAPSLCVADLAGIQPELAALARIEVGSTAEHDFTLLAGRWDIRQQLQQALARNGLGYLDIDTAANRLSGGEVMRVRLIGALLSRADFLILDEPSNHLDSSSRQQLLDQLMGWPTGLIVISHDRQLLMAMPRIVELSAQGLVSYGGNYAFYRQARAAQRQAAQQQLAHQQREQRQVQQALQIQQSRQQRHQARGRRRAKVANQAKVLLGQKKGRNEIGQAKQVRHQALITAEHKQRVQQAAQRVVPEPSVHLPAVTLPDMAKGDVVRLNRAILPWVNGMTRCIDLVLGSGQRLAIQGPNGCGKSTLLRLLAGQLALPTGECWINGTAVYLDQQLAVLNPQRSVLEQLQQANPGLAEATRRRLLVQLGLGPQQITLPSEQLSAGERLKGALACLLYAQVPVQLLLLDEPTNHLDLAGQQALEALLLAYPGTMVVVSHDRCFLDNLALTDCLTGSDEGWCLQAYVSQ